MRVGPQIDSVHLVLPLVAYPHIDEIRREYVSFEKEVVILLQVVQGLTEGARSAGDASLLLW